MSVPLPVFVIPRPVPLITPARLSVALVTRIVLLAPSVMPPARLLAPPVLIWSVPPLSVSASAPTATACRSSVAPLATTVPAAVPPRALAWLTASVPALTVVAPV